MPKKKKHSKDMTTEEAMKHLFTHKGFGHIKRHVAKLNKVSSTRKG